MQLSVTVRDARLDAIESTITTAPTLEIWSGTKPANCAASDAGDGAILCTMTLPSNWMNDAATGAKTLLGTWSGTGAAAAGTGTAATHFRLKHTAVCHIQGTATGAAGAGPLKLSNISIAEDQPVTVETFTITDGNA